MKTLIIHFFLKFSQALSKRVSFNQHCTKNISLVQAVDMQKFKTWHINDFELVCDSHNSDL